MANPLESAAGELARSANPLESAADRYKRYLLDFLQGASNEAAGTVSAPVDGLAWLLRKAGIPVNAPIGGSDWMEQRGLTRPVKQSAAQVAGATAGLLSPVAAAAKAPQIARGLLQAGANVAAPSTIPRLGERGMILYHGSNDTRPIREIKPGGGVFGGLFTSPNRGTAESHGDILYRLTVPDEAILTQYALEYQVPYQSVRDAMPKYVPPDAADNIADLVVSGKSAFSADIPEDRLLSALRADSVGEADWELQRIRGIVGSKLGYKAVEMPDEHGVSYLVTGGAKPRPANQQAKAMARAAASKK